MTTNSNNVSISKVDLNSHNGKYKSANNSSGRIKIENTDYPIDSNDIHILSNENNEVIGNHERQREYKVIHMEMAEKNTK